MNDVTIFNSNQSNVEYGDRVETTKKCGYIRIKGEKEDRKISWELYQKLMNLPSTYDGAVTLTELNIKIPYSQIAKIEASEYIETQYKDFSRLPTRSIELNIDFTPKQRPASLSVPENGSYYLAVVHYVTKNNDFEYILDKNKIKKLTLVEVIDGEEFCSEIYEYGRKVYPNYSEDC